MGTIESSVDKTVAKLEVQLEQWAAKLDELVASAEQAGEQAKRDSRERIGELKTKLAAAQARLDEAKLAGADKWDTMKQGLERSWKALERIFQRLVH